MEDLNILYTILTHSKSKSFSDYEMECLTKIIEDIYGVGMAEGHPITTKSELKDYFLSWGYEGEEFHPEITKFTYELIKLFNL